MKLNLRKSCKYNTMKTAYCENDQDQLYEIGIDEAGRGPMLGRVYAAAVILPPAAAGNVFNHALMKDSKKFHSEKKYKPRRLI